MWAPLINFQHERILRQIHPRRFGGRAVVRVGTGIATQHLERVLAGITEITA